ncbi:hypothetical protein GCM10011497_36740 [Elstera cyanobacteriorum]|uniref:Uncharacterized protein n=1 Tax=Elstera cyanobacteriorum TaxID=2022747 RepID=A0A255XY80_9PROT|nr:hypothetical protein [Elstera cyanobacteriorum]OYQ21882.1 hypothetical protein CHR90_00900 [Elstera cyanobacteriorum]GGA02728.1 hypothetical protein GCM10011497_36740 [Elstera cyanobacteriorum]
MAEPDSPQFKLAITVMSIAAGLMTVLVTGLLWAAARSGNPNDFLDTGKLLLTAILPVVSAWVGTILAFFYSKENYLAASQGTLDAVKAVSARLASRKLRDVMMPKASVIAVTLGPSGVLGDLMCAQVVAGFETLTPQQQRINRLLFLRADGSCAAVLHRSIWNEMLAQVYQAPGKSIDLKADPLSALIDQSQPGGTGPWSAFLSRTLAFVGEAGSLADAKAAMAAVPNCQDVIVTRSGIPTEPMLGWISNVDITRESQA